MIITMLMTMTTLMRMMILMLLLMMVMVILLMIMTMTMKMAQSQKNPVSMSALLTQKLLLAGRWVYVMFRLECPDSLTVFG